jgi:hypothetical protein
VIEEHRGYRLPLHAYPRGHVLVAAGPDYVTLDVVAGPGMGASILLLPDEALDLALYLQRERRLLEKGSG